MAFSSAVCNKTVFGNKKVANGCWTAASVTTGTIDTGIVFDVGALNVYSEAAGTSTITIVPSANRKCITLTALETGHCGGWTAWGKRR